MRLIEIFLLISFSTSVFTLSILPRPPIKWTKRSNAYMLVYIRETDKENIFCNVDEKDIAEHLRVSFMI